MRPSATNIAFLGVVALLFQTGPASAYLDPGTGSMMLQALLGGIAGAAVVGNVYWRRLKEVMTSRFFGKPDKTAPARRVTASSETKEPHE